MSTRNSRKKHALIVSAALMITVANQITISIRFPQSHATTQSRTQSMPVRRFGAGHDSGETEYRISNFGYPVSCAHAHAQTATLNLRGRH